MAKILILNTYTIADLASSDSTAADSTVIKTIGVTKGGNYIGLDSFIKRGLDQILFIKEFFRQMDKFKVKRGLIEKNRAENLKPTIKRLLDSKFFGAKNEVYRKLWFKITMIPHYGKSKLDRFIDNLQCEHAAKHIWVKNSWTKDKEFFMMYPVVTHDDIGDVWEMAVSNSKKPLNSFMDSAFRGRVMMDSSDELSDSSNVARLKRTKFNFWTGTWVER